MRFSAECIYLTSLLLVLPACGGATPKDEAGRASIEPAQAIDLKNCSSWVGTWGGEYEDYPTDVAVDASGSVYVVGHYCSLVDFDPGPGTKEMTSSGPGGFLSKFDPNGRLLWAISLDGYLTDEATGVTVDGSGCIYVVGSFMMSVDFDPGTGTELRTSYNSMDAFVAKYDSDGHLRWVRAWGGDRSDAANAVGVAESGNVYVAGYFMGTVDFGTDCPGSRLASDGLYDIFVCSFDGSGELRWATGWGAASWDSAQDLAVDGSGNVYVTGEIRHTHGQFSDVAGAPLGRSDLIVSEGDYRREADSDIFLTKLDSSGVFQWDRTWGGDSSDKGCGVALDRSWNVYVTGHYAGTFESRDVDFDPGPEVDIHEGRGCFLSKFDPDGGFQWARTWGGRRWEVAHAIALDGWGNIYVAGEFQEAIDLDPDPQKEEIPDCLWGAFLSKFNPDGDLQSACAWASAGRGLAIDTAGNVYVAGEVNDDADLNPGPDVDAYVADDGEDVFLTKFALGSER